MKVIILAAGVGKRIRGVTKDPKCLIRIKDEPLIVRNIRILKSYGINSVVVVSGYKHGKLVKAVRSAGLKVKFIENADYRDGSIISLWRAAEELRGDIVIMDADLYFEGALVENIMRSRKNNFFLIDTKAKKDKEAVIVGFKKGRAAVLERGLRWQSGVCGEWAGFLKLSAAGAAKLRSLIKNKVSLGERKVGYEFIIPELFEKITISYELIDGLKWVEIDFPKDLKRAMSLSIN